MSKKILIFASGRGSNAEAIHEATVNGTIDGTVIGVICDHADAQVLERAKRWNVPATVVERKDFATKADFNAAILSAANRMSLMPFAQISTRIGGAATVIGATILLQMWH